MGAAGRDFHNFNTLFKNNRNYEVICFTASQIPKIENRIYPKELSGKLYENGIEIYPEKEIENIIKKLKINEVVLSYSDISNEEIMDRASLVNSIGADFRILSAESTMLRSKRKIISICAVRTGCGKSQTTRKIAQILKKHKKRFVVVRHPMPYGNLKKQEVQRFENLKDLDRYSCTIEEREEYEHHIKNGTVVYAGVNYQKILKQAEQEAEIILWDGGNNDTPFFKPDLHIVVCDGLRPNHEMRYYHGTLNLRLADVAIINKENSSSKKDIIIIEKNIKKINPRAKIIHADSLFGANKKVDLKDKKVLVIEDGPTLTHGGMEFGVGYLYSRWMNAKIIDGKKFAKGSIKKVYEKYPHIKLIVPAMGYFPEQIKEIEKIIKSANPDFIVSGTPIDLNLVIKTKVPIIRIEYYLNEKNIKLEKILKEIKII